MFIRGLLLAVMFLAVSASPTMAGTRDPNVPDVKYQEFGAQFPFILRIRVHKKLEDDKTLYMFASAVAIRPQWVLTAAHIIDELPDGGHIYKTGENENGFPIELFIMHGEFKDELVGWHDIALCRIKGDLGLDFYPGLYAGDDEINKVVTLSGWGATGTFLSGYTHFDDKRRAGSNQICVIENGVLVCQPDKQNRTALEFLICPGDSGGGLFIGNELAGIVSFISGPSTRGQPKARYGDTGAFTRVSLYRDWINDNITRVDKAYAEVEAKNTPDKR